MSISRGTLLSFHHLPHPTSTPLLPQQIESFCSPRQLPRPTHRPRTHQPSTSLLLLLLLLPLSFLIRLAARGRIVLPQLVCGPRASKSGGDRKSTVFRERCAAENWSVSRSWYRVVAGKPALRHPFLLAHFILGSLKTLDHTESASSSIFFSSPRIVGIFSVYRLASPTIPDAINTRIFIYRRCFFPSPPSSPFVWIKRAPRCCFSRRWFRFPSGFRRFI